VNPAALLSMDVPKLRRWRRRMKVRIGKRSRIAADKPIDAPNLNAEK
jgi:hypothetical protein